MDESIVVVALVLLLAAVISLAIAYILRRMKYDLGFTLPFFLGLFLIALSIMFLTGLL